MAVAAGSHPDLHGDVCADQDAPGNGRAIGPGRNWRVCHSSISRPLGCPQLRAHKACRRAGKAHRHCAEHGGCGRAPMLSSHLLSGPLALRLCVSPNDDIDGWGSGVAGSPQGCTADNTIRSSQFDPYL